MRGHGLKRRLALGAALPMWMGLGPIGLTAPAAAYALGMHGSGFWDKFTKIGLPILATGAAVYGGYKGYKGAFGSKAAKGSAFENPVAGSNPSPARSLLFDHAGVPRPPPVQIGSQAQALMNQGIGPSQANVANRPFFRTKS